MRKRGKKEEWWCGAPLAPDGRGRGRRAAPTPSHISDALFERLSTKSFSQASASLSLSLSLLPLSFGSPLSRPLVLAQWVFNPMKHLRLSPSGADPTMGRGRGNMGKTPAKQLPCFHVQNVAFLFATCDSFRRRPQ